MKIIVLTPVKNEAWILKQFIEATLQFADAIIIADQQSTDGSREIAEGYEKVVLIDNLSNQFNEKERQPLLIDYARKIYGSNSVLIALDADEVVAAVALKSEYWMEIRKLNPGTILYFRKIDIEEGCENIADETETFYPLGFVDDGQLKHYSKAIHSVRIPLGNEMQPKVEIRKIFFLHLHKLRPLTQAAKRRFYQIMEKDFKVNPWYWRRYRYGKNGFYSPSEKTKPLPPEWVAYPPSLHINVKTMKEEVPIWFDLEVNSILSEKGGVRYWLDNIWNKDWNDVSNNKKIWQQPKILGWLLMGFDHLFIWLYKLKSKVKTFK